MDKIVIAHCTPAVLQLMAAHSRARIARADNLAEVTRARRNLNLARAALQRARVAARRAAAH